MATSEVNLHPEVDAWYLDLDHDTANRVEQAIDMLAAEGPGLGRPLVDHVKASRHHNMKELRATTSVRILFAFDPRREAILLVAGDKRGQWDRWYKTSVPVADDRYDEWLDATNRGGRMPSTP
ncbi:MAG: type II toxin-antitoxin system RelE/ParE family toxin [Jiangellaceae bacterium]